MSALNGLNSRLSHLVLATLGDIPFVVKIAKAPSQRTADTQTHFQASILASATDHSETHIDLALEDVAGGSMARELDDPLGNSIIIGPGLCICLTHFFCLYIKHHALEVPPGNAFDCYVVAQADAEPPLEQGGGMGSSEAGAGAQYGSYQRLFCKPAACQIPVSLPAYRANKAQVTPRWGGAEGEGGGQGQGERGVEEVGRGHNGQAERQGLRSLRPHVQTSSDPNMTHQLFVDGQRLQGCRHSPP